MRTFHIGGTASRVIEQSYLTTKNEGLLKYHNLKTVVNRNREIVVLNRNGQIGVTDASGRELERYTVPQGTVVAAEEGKSIAKGTVLVRWDPYTSPILTEVSGAIRYEDIKDGVTMREELDQVTGVVDRMIIEHKGDFHPQILILDARKEVVGLYPLPAGAHIVAKEGQEVRAGDLLAKTPRKITKTKDITGGLPRVAELFEARRPKDPAIISEIDGAVEFGGAKKGQRLIIVRSQSAMVKEYLIPHGKHLNVYKGDVVQAGQALTDGPIVPQDILRVSGDKKLQEYLVNEVQQVYRLQGVRINDKHIEIIVRQMLRKVKIEDPGDTEFLIGTQVDRSRFQEENQRITAKGKKPAKASPVLLGITKASLSTESFISAASFQETTRVLTEAATTSKIDYLKGLKENVIIGHMIPAGTGLQARHKLMELAAQAAAPRVGQGGAGGGAGERSERSERRGGDGRRVWRRDDGHGRGVRVGRGVRGDADDQPVDPDRAPEGSAEVEIAGAQRLPAAPRRLLAGPDDDAEETELGAAQDRSCPADESHGGHGVYSGRGA
jgi:DNA-directed RNA polymerase subunit beta'